MNQCAMAKQDSSLDTLLACLRSSRFPLGSEVKTQEAIENALTAAGIDHCREFRLSSEDRVDFFVNGVAVEIKVRADSARAIFRQVERYARHDIVTAIVLVSNKPMGLPTEINGKPAYFVNLARTWM